MFWVAPELLRLPSASLLGTKEGDIYSCAIIMQEVVFREPPFFTVNMEPQGKLFFYFILWNNNYRYKE